MGAGFTPVHCLSTILSLDATEPRMIPWGLGTERERHFLAWNFYFLGRLLRRDRKPLAPLAGM